MGDLIIYEKYWQRRVFIFLWPIFILSCQSKHGNVAAEQTAQYLQGYWVPQKIRWQIEDPRYRDSGRLFETAHFSTLCFERTNKFILFGSTQRHQSIDNDSIIFAGEPLVTVFGGSWQSINDTLLKVDYVPIEYNINPPDKRERHEQIKILLQKDTLLLFEGELYHRSYKYDKISQQTIERYKKHYLK